MSTLLDQLLESARIITDAAAEAVGAPDSFGGEPLKRLVKATREVHELLLQESHNLETMGEFVANVGVEIDLLRLVERSAAYAGEEQQPVVEFLVEAVGVLTVFCSSTSRGFKGRLVEERQCASVMMKLLLHAEHQVAIQAAECLGKIVRINEVEYRTMVLDNEDTMDCIAQLLDEIADAADAGIDDRDSSIDAATKLANVVGNIIKGYNLPAETIERVIPLVPGIGKLFQAFSAGDEDDDVEAAILVPILTSIFYLCRGYTEQTLQAAMDYSLPKLVVQYLLQRQEQRPFAPPPQQPIPGLGLEMFCEVTRDHARRFVLDMDGLSAIQCLLRHPESVVVDVSYVVSVLNNIVDGNNNDDEEQEDDYEEYGDSTDLIEHLLGCDDLFLQVCNVVVLAQARESRGFLTRNGLAWTKFLGKFMKHSTTDVFQVDNAVKRQHIVHALALTCTIGGDPDLHYSACSALRKLVRRLGLDTMQQYVRDLLRTREFFPLVDKFRLNNEPDSVFSAVFETGVLCNSASVVSLFLLVGVEETDVAKGARGQYTPSPYYRDYFERFRRTRVMIVLCATRTVARCRQKVVDLPEELWRMVHEMLFPRLGVEMK